MQPMIPCEQCDGKGRVPLPKVLQEVYDAIKSGVDTAPEIWKAIPGNTLIGVTAINRRLAQMLEMGLVQRIMGLKRTYRYTLTPTLRKHHGRQTSRSSKA